MAKVKKGYVCSECGEDFIKWQGQCSNCKEWNTVTEVTLSSSSSNKDNSRTSWISSDSSKILKSSEINTEQEFERVDTTISELNRVLGGGLTIGSINIITGEPGAGKSTLVIQAMTGLSTVRKCLYVTGEESLFQVKNRAKRLKLDDKELYYLSETNVESIIEKAMAAKIEIMVIDSIQTLNTNQSTSIAGSVSQIRDSASMLVQYGKKHNVSFFIIGHVTKDGSMAGPKVLEHMVDSTLDLSGDSGSRYRMLRSKKNRFGKANESGIFAMTEEGMKEVKNPSAMFINSHSEDVSGSAIFVSQEGNRPLLFEVQALVTDSLSEIPRRLSVGVNFQRVTMLLAIMQKHGNVKFNNKDIYVNVVGGITIPNTETSCDLGVCFAIYSSIREIVIPRTIAAFGEISLSGEIRPVPNGEERILEAQKHGFTHILAPISNISKQLLKKATIKIIPVKNINEATIELNKLIKK